MAELDPLVAEILLKGDTEFLSSIKKIGADGAEAFEKLNKSVASGASSFSLAGQALGALEAAVAGIIAATVLFVEQQTELSQKTILLAEAFGTTAGQLQDLEAVFASAGVKVEQFERFANRLTITIAREWPQIAESIKTYATQNDAATLRVSAAIQRVREAQNALADNSAERFSAMSKDSLALEASYLKLQFAAQHAAAEQQAAMQAVNGATLGTTAALQHLAELEGRPPSAAEKQNLQIAQAQQAVDTARRAEADARLAQQEKLANASLKQRQLEQENDDLARKAAKNARDDIEQRIKDEARVKEAVIARAEAEEKAAKLALTNISSIRDALDGVTKGNKAAAETVDLTKVSVQNLTKAIIAQAAETSKSGTPTGYETLIQLSKTLSKATNEQITTEQKLAVVNKLAGTSMQALGVSAAEILHVLEHNTDALSKFSDAAKALDTKEAQHRIEEFRGALASLNLSISILSQRFAIAVSPVFTAFLRAIENSIESNNGLIHLFIQGLIGLGETLSYIGSKLGTVVDYFTRLFSGGLLSGADLFKASLVGIGVAIIASTGPIGLMIVAIGGLVIAIGYIREHWDEIKAAIDRAWERLKDSTVGQFIQGIIDRVQRLKELWDSIFNKKAEVGVAAARATGEAAGASGNKEGLRLAGGGPVDGPGTTTSDSIFARLSRGEFVVRAAAVQQYGQGLFHALNNMQMPGFASGGLVPSPVRMGGGSIAPATSTLNLSIDGRSFNGLRGPKSTIDDLSSFAISRESSAAGLNPSWYG